MSTATPTTTEPATSVQAQGLSGVDIEFDPDQVLFYARGARTSHGISVDYGQALELHRQLGEALGLTHPRPSSPFTASRATASPRSGQHKP